MISDLDIHYFWPKRQVLEKNKKGVEKLVWRRIAPVHFNPPGAGGVCLCGKLWSVSRLCTDIEHVTCRECILVWTSRIARAMW